jgi:BirA family biotin operon repressor/biotin-[acetyl-CoA-carboxylase] ligase
MGKNMIYVPECHSTNTLALELASQPSIIEGSVIITDHQTAGRGQRGNTWEAAKGKNLTFSVVLRPLFLPIKDQFFLNIFTSLAIHDFLRDKINAIIRIKWPNDILINNKKIGGILIENQIRASQVSITVVGIGLNVNQVDFNVGTATSLAALTGSEQGLSQLLEQLLQCLEARYLQLRQGNLNALREEYLQQLYWRGEDHVFTSGGISIQGKITGIDESGRLAMDTVEGVRSFDIKEISYVQ